MQGEKVKLVQLERDHTEALYNALSHSQVWEFLLTKVRKYEDMDKIVEKALKGKEQGKELPFTLIDLETNEILGTTRIGDISISHRSAEIGWTWLTPSVWRTGINPETKYLLLKYCFEEMKLRRVQFKIHARNKRSIRAVERLGAVKEGELRNMFVWDDGDNGNQVIFSILDTEWDMVEKRLKGSLI
ncbi:hypothetical protein PAECIP111891_07015 [Paenibacillus allorhizoplanae]|uniref:N-acetyltransferase domain-containing protein n=1 Tax=Paenibacillus allorhizoplanae TaxID=2905648 RepID=A0ABN8HAU7_9BACL|nr:GNAT family N-acetyltransferase [Paenibacillus allorhizoplanae]CAH1232467.1 hypothetical protein PAECIP111891_07015 [Paenibacillus allorhizoplanae]